MTKLDILNIGLPSYFCCFRALSKAPAHYAQLIAKLNKLLDG
jgi:hypothetical protein